MGISDKFNRFRGRNRVDDVEEARRLAEIENEARKRRDEEEKEARIRKKTEELHNEDAQDATGRGGGLINVYNIQKGTHSWIAYILWTIFIFLLLYFGAYKYVLPSSLKIEFNFFGIFVYSGVILFIAYIIIGFVSAAKNKDKDIKITNFFVALVLLIWLWDLAPPYIGPFKIPFGGIYYQGFIWGLSAPLYTTIFLVLTSSAMFAFFYINLIFKIVEKEYIGAILAFSFIIITNKLAPYFVPDQFRFPIAIQWGNTAFIVTTLIGLAFISFLVFMYKKQGVTSAFPNFLSFLFMAFVFSFFWINNGWLVNIKAIAHAVYIVLFGFLYITRMESKSPSTWHFLIPILLIADFYGYGALFGSNILVLTFFPVLVLFVVVYCYHKTRSVYALTTVAVIVTIILILSLQATGYEESTVTFTPQEGGSDLNTFIGSIFGKTQDLILERLDYASGGYLGLVEKNQYAPLGVYFDKVRAAQPKFYNDEDVTLWGTLKSKTLSDPVIINFTCYRQKDEPKRMEALKQKDQCNDKNYDCVIPNTPFTVYTLEDKDLECTFTQDSSNPKLPAGTNQITFSASYNFATNAYQKVYFIDKDRLRAMTRQNLDPFKEFGIKDTSPNPVSTNGPVQIKLTRQDLIPVSQDSSLSPVIGIQLINRGQITDSTGKPFGQWVGKIRKINELIIVLPNGVTIDGNSCKPVTFKDFRKENCQESCVSNVNIPCTGVCGESDADCKQVCADAQKKCVTECEDLFKDDSGQAAYQGFQLNLDELNKLQNRDDYRNIDRFKEFQCRLIPTKDTLENVPITTKFVRVRARYDYLVEKTFPVLVEQAPQTIGSTTSSLIQKYAQAEGIDPDLIKAIALIESSAQHCNDGSTQCSKNNVKISKAGSLGIMQINVVLPNGHPEWKTDASSICGSGKTAYDIDCNILLGIRMLKEKYNAFKDRPPSNLESNCPKSSQYYNKYLSYRGWNAALRGYNGWGCLKNSDPGFVENVSDKRDKIKNGLITSDEVSRLQAIESYLPKTKTQQTYPPLNPTAEFDNKKVTIRWDYSLSPDVTQYLVSKYYQDSNIDSKATPNAFLEDNEVEGGKEYTYVIMAIDDGFNVYGSAEVKITPTIGAGTIIAPPTNARAEDTKIARNSISVFWNPSPTPNVNYGVYRYIKQSGESKAYYGITGTIYVDNDVQDSIEYFYRITALNDYDESTYAETNTVKSVDDATY